MDKNNNFTNTAAFKISSIAVLSAIVAIFTIVVRIPIAPTKGYVNLGDVAIYFTAFIMGPVSALIAGGLGTAFADILSGYGQWAPISFVVHGLQGLIVGLIYTKVVKKNIVITSIFCFLAGTVIMATGYFISSAFIVGAQAALVEVPGNVLQNVAGIFGGTILAQAVQKAYPPVVNFSW
jgi:uncharacterized membrane protein